MESLLGMFANLSCFTFSKSKSVVIVGGGKAAVRMAEAAEDFFGDRIHSGHVVTKYKHAAGNHLKRIGVTEAAHPVPDKNSVAGSMTLFETLKNKPKDSVVITLISGGGSALLSAPAPNVTLDDIRQTTNVLLACGATIHEINSIRKHLSVIKGGHLAEAAFPNPCYSLILSDVMGDDLSTIASGPTHFDHTSFQDCKNIIDKYGIWDKLSKG